MTVNISLKVVLYDSHLRIRFTNMTDIHGLYDIN